MISPDLHALALFRGLLADQGVIDAALRLPGPVDLIERLESGAYRLWSGRVCLDVALESSRQPEGKILGGLPTVRYVPGAIQFPAAEAPASSPRLKPFIVERSSSRTQQPTVFAKAKGAGAAIK